MPNNTDWNGLSRLVQLMGEARIETQIPMRLDLGTIAPGDALLIINPSEALPSDALTAFLQAGGRIGLFDENGESRAFLEQFQITRVAMPQETPRLRDNPALRIGHPHAVHDLTSGVSALVSNHTSTLSQPDLTPLIEFSEGHALLLAGIVGDGRLIVASDASLIINNMLEFRGNQRFARNLLTYLTQRAPRGTSTDTLPLGPSSGLAPGLPSGTLYLILPSAALVGRFGDPGADRPLHDFRRSLERLARLPMPPSVLLFISLFIVLGGLLLAIVSLPRESPYRAERMFARPPVQGGYAGRMAYFSHRQAPLVHPILVYKFEFETELLQKLHLRDPSVLAIVAQLESRGTPKPKIEEMRTFLQTLSDIQARQEHGRTPRIRSAQLRDLLQTGERLLTMLEPG